MIQINKYLDDMVNGKVKELSRYRLQELNRLGFKESTYGNFVLEGVNGTTLLNITQLSVEFWRDYIDYVKIKMQKSIVNNRSCFNCKLSTVCFAFRELKTTLIALPTNLYTDDAPMRQTDVFKALAGCCLVYEENN